MKLPKPYRDYGCHNPEAGRRLHRACPRLGTNDHGAWYVRYEAPRLIQERSNSATDQLT